MLGLGKLLNLVGPKINIGSGAAIASWFGPSSASVSTSIAQVLGGKQTAMIAITFGVFASTVLVSAFNNITASEVGGFIRALTATAMMWGARQVLSSSVELKEAEVEKALTPAPASAPSAQVVKPTEAASPSTLTGAVVDMFVDTSTKKIEEETGIKVSGSMATLVKEALLGGPEDKKEESKALEAYKQAKEKAEAERKAKELAEKQEAEKALQKTLREKAEQEAKERAEAEKQEAAKAPSEAEEVEVKEQKEQKEQESALPDKLAKETGRLGDVVDLAKQEAKKTVVNQVVDLVKENPGTAALIVGGVSVGGYLLYQNQDKISSAVTGMKETVKGFFDRKELTEEEMLELAKQREAEEQTLAEEEARAAAEKQAAEEAKAAEEQAQERARELAVLKRNNHLHAQETLDKLVYEVKDVEQQILNLQYEYEKYYEVEPGFSMIWGNKRDKAKDKLLEFARGEGYVAELFEHPFYIPEIDTHSSMGLSRHMDIELYVNNKVLEEIKELSKLDRDGVKDKATSIIEERVRERIIELGKGMGEVRNTDLANLTAFIKKNKEPEYGLFANVCEVAVQYDDTKAKELPAKLQNKEEVKDIAHSVVQKLKDHELPDPSPLGGGTLGI